MAWRCGTGTLLEAWARIGDVDCLVIPIAGSGTATPLVRRFARRLIVMDPAGLASTQFSLLSSLSDPRGRLEAFTQFGEPSMVARIANVPGDAIAALAAGGRYQILQVCRSYLLPLASKIGPAIGNPPLVVDFDEDDVETSRSLARMHRASRDWLKAAWWEQEAIAYAALYRRSTGRVSVGFAASDLEVGRIAARIPDVRLVTVPNAVPPQRSTGRRRHCAPQVLFVGALDYAPNRDAAAWLLRDFWPRLRGAGPTRNSFLSVAAAAID